jgi:hypothetical protein
LSFVALMALMASLAYGAQGEYWEMTFKMEMAGMPMAMPARTTKICIAKGSERDPRKAAPNKECEFSDVKIVGNKSSWTMRCNHDGEIMTGVGEFTGTADKSDGTMHLTGTSGGRSYNMTQTISNRRLGGDCDTEETTDKLKNKNTDELANKIKSQMCDTSTYQTAQWISSAQSFLSGDACPGKKEPLCAAVRKDAPRDLSTYHYLTMYEKSNGGLIARTCGINMDATLKSLCKTVNSDNAESMASDCPAEVKVVREDLRRKSCEGRSYTAKDGLSNCLGGTAPTAKASAPAAPAPSKLTTEESNSQPATPNPAAAVLEGAKKLKGLFGL